MSAVAPNPYDEVPYLSQPIEWTAPERLALASLLHGGPRLPLADYRVLELGCGNGANLLPLAYYRRHARFVGVDGSGAAIATAKTRQAELGLSNLHFIHADFADAAERLEGPFDFILVHGVVSWVPEQARDALLALCARHLRTGGLVYVNYNARPGWNVRGMVRDLLLAQTASAGGLRARAERAQEVSRTLASALGAAGDHPWARLMEREFRFVFENDLSYVAHEYLAADNHAYWRSEFLGLARKLGLQYVADADFNYVSGRIPEGIDKQMAAAQISAQRLDDTVDLLSYRQLHSPILTSDAWTPLAPDDRELGNLIVASCLVSQTTEGTPRRMFRHPSGFEVEAKEEAMGLALERLRALWPTGALVRTLFPPGSPFIDDLRLLHRHGMIELRLADSPDDAPPRRILNECERRWGGCVTTPDHRREAPEG